MQRQLSHRAAYPAQYSHPMCGQPVVVTSEMTQFSGVVERVVESRFGALFRFEGSCDTWYRLADASSALVANVDRAGAIDAIVDWLGDTTMRSLAARMVDLMISDGRLFAAGHPIPSFQLQDGVDLNEVACQATGH